jgi:hypothetical protein
MAGLFVAGAALAQEIPTETPQPATPPPAAVEAAPTPSSEPVPTRPRIMVTPSLSAYFPTSSKTRDEIGGTWVGLGIRLGVGEDRRPSGLGFRFDVISHTSSGVRAYVVPLTVAYSRRLRPELRNASPYAGIGASVVGVKVRIDDGSTLVKASEAPEASSVNTGWKLKPGVNVFAGYPLNARTLLEADYHFVSSVEGYNLSGAKLSLSYRL